MGMTELYYFAPAGANSGKAYLALLEKGVEFVRRPLDALNFEHYRPAFLAINPKGQVPTLVHNGLVISESTPLGEYIDEAFAGPPLRPGDPFERWRMRWWLQYLDEDFGPALMMLTWSQLVRNFMGDRSPEEVERIIDNMPTAERRESWRKAYRQEIPAADLAESLRRAEVGIKRMEQALVRYSWLAGAAYSLADICIFNIVGGVPQRWPELVNAQTTPYFLAWLERVRERPAVQRMRAENPPAA